MAVYKSGNSWTWNHICGASGGTYATKNAAQHAYDNHVSACND